MERTLINYLGLLGVVSLISYLAAMIFSPLAYPGYDRRAQAVSDLSAEDSPSRTLWNRIAAPYSICGVVSVTAVCIFVDERLNFLIRLGIHLFCVMNWISDTGYKMFPLSTGGSGRKFQDKMHIFVITPAVVLLSIASLVLIIIGGLRRQENVSLAVSAAVALAMMFVGSIGSGVVPKSLFGVFERLSLISAVGFNAVLGIYLFNGFWV